MACQLFLFVKHSKTKDYASNNWQKFRHCGLDSFIIFGHWENHGFQQKKLQAILCALLFGSMPAREFKIGEIGSIWIWMPVQVQASQAINYNRIKQKLR